MKKYPHLNDTYITDKLKEQLMLIESSPMTLIVAPAGYGKSTAITWWDEYRRNNISRSSVYRLNIMSDDIDTAWSDLCSLFGKDAPQLSEKLMKIGFPHNLQRMQLLSQLWEDAEEEDEKEIYIVVDDAHLLPYSSLVPFLLFLAPRLQPQVHIVLLSRNFVFSYSQRMQLGRSLFQISSESFQLNSEEVHGYAAQCGLPLSVEETEQLAQFSGGWISLIYLAFCNFAQTGTWQFGTADIDQLITEVMLDPLEKREREFLIVCSVTPKFTEDLAIYLWDSPEAKLFLDRLSRENAFIVRDKKGVYCCHNLLHKNTVKEFLRLPVEKQRTIWERLGNWYFEKNNYLSAAVSYRKAEAWDKLLQTVATDRNSSFSGNHMVQVSEWCRSCPEECLRRHPDAVLIFALQHFIDGDIPTMLQLNRFLMDVVKNNPRLSEQDKANYAGESEILKGFLEFNNIAGMSIHHRAACELMDRQSLLVNHRSPWTFGSPSILALYHRKSGELEAENASMRECMPYYYELTNHHGNGSEISMLAESEFMQGRFQDAEIHCFHAARAARRKNQYSILITAEFTAVRIGFLQGEYVKSFSRLSDIRRQLLDLNEFVLIPTIDLCEVWLFSLLGQKDRIPEMIWAEDAVKTVMAVSTPIAMIIRNEALLASGKYTETVSYCEEIIKICEKTNMLLCGIYIRIQLSAALLHLNKKVEALAALTEALDLAAPDSLIMPFAEHGVILRPLTEELKNSKKYSAVLKKIYELTDVFEKSCKKIREEHFGDMPDTGLSARELEIARLAARRMTTKEISEQLYLSENTVRNHLGHIFSKLGIEGTARNKREKLAEMIPQLKNGI